MKKLSIIVPVYFNEGSLPDLFAKLSGVRESLARRDVGLELIFVDDGSGDGSLALLKKYKESQPGARVLKLSRNFGAISAVKTGIMHVTGDCFLFLAADLQDPPSLIPEMVDHWLSGKKYVICARTNREDPLTSKLSAKIYYRMLRTFVIASYPEKGFDLALMDSMFLPYLRDSGKHVNFPLFPYWMGIQPHIIYYKRQAREHGRSRWTFGKKIKLLIDSIFSFSFAPVRIISLVGATVSFCSFAYGILVAISALLGKVVVPGFATIVCLISFLLGLIIVMLGIISEYVWRIFDEVNKHPYSVVEEIL